MTPENVMKPGPIHPAEDRHNWAPADEIVDYRSSKSFEGVTAHTLCWHQQTW